ncbi:hypothetical protein [Baaleninema simplex]|uniref:hypothetical protein n=1 Tax=Baaleninema simplex TaxID=2862350 RepID=UPI0003458402|nr:hypothetical protein [Baaleninema simplex]
MPIAALGKKPPSQHELTTSRPRVVAIFGVDPSSPDSEKDLAGTASRRYAMRRYA